MENLKLGQRVFIHVNERKHPFEEPREVIFVEYMANGVLNFWVNNKGDAENGFIAVPSSKISYMSWFPDMFAFKEELPKHLRAAATDCPNAR